MLNPESNGAREALTSLGLLCLGIVESSNYFCEKKNCNLVMQTSNHNNDLLPNSFTSSRPTIVNIFIENISGYKAISQCATASIGHDR
jgi:hypothetical protein